MLLTLVVFVGLMWATYQLFSRLLIGEIDESTLRYCPFADSETTYNVVTAGAVLAALAALAFGLARRPRAAYTAVGVEALFAVAWFAVDGDRAAGCVVGI
jgi:hypothetical protein